MTTAAALDPREARPLTSREIAKVLNGIIACVVTRDPKSREAIPQVLDMIRVNPLDFEGMDYVATTMDGPRTMEAVRADGATWATALSATVVGLQSWCDHRDISTALMWVSQNLHLVLPPFDGIRPAN